MTENATLLGHLTPMLTNRIEEIATEALGYIMSKSSSSKEALNDIVESAVENVNPVTHVLTQKVGSDGTRPDLVGMDESKAERVLIEAKFGAELTPRQPNAYLDRLPADTNSVLLFVVPKERVKHLWPALRSRIISAGNTTCDVDGERKCIRIEGTTRHLMLVSWTSLLDRMSSQAREAGELEIESDIQQLRGLAAYAETGAVSPFHQSGEDYGPESSRMKDLKHLIDTATDRAIGAGWADRKGLNRTPRSYGYGRYIRLYGTTVWFGVNRDLWEEDGVTPLWVEAYPLKATPVADLWEPTDLHGRNKTWIPIAVLPDTEFNKLLDDVVDQLMAISEAL